MHHVTEYCNVIGTHCAVRRDKACIRSSPDPSLSCGSGSGLRDYVGGWLGMRQCWRVVGNEAMLATVIRLIWTML